jgi:hypothetical protein
MCFGCAGISEPSNQIDDFGLLMPCDLGKHRQRQYLPLIAECIGKLFGAMP